VVLMVKDDLRMFGMTVVGRASMAIIYARTRSIAETIKSGDGYAYRGVLAGCGMGTMIQYSTSAGG